MPHPLDGARLKVVRAQKHLQLLKHEILSYRSTNPHEFPTEQEGDVRIARPAVIKAGCEPPEELSCIIGEGVSPLRSSLDYISWELASRYHKPRPVVGKNKDISFPILDSPTGDGANRFAKMAKKWSFPAAAVSLIQSVQPHHAGYEPLRLLSLLTNTDKHCLPLLTVAYVNTASMEVTVQGPPLGACIMEPPGSKIIVTGSNVAGMSLRRLTLEDLKDPFFNLPIPGVSGLAARDAPGPGSPEQQPRSVKVDGQVTIFVALKDSPVPFVPVDGTVEQLVECVMNIIPRFEQFF